MSQFKYFDRDQAKILVNHLLKIPINEWVKAEHLAEICGIKESQNTNWSRLRALAKKTTSTFGIPIVSGNKGFKIADTQGDIDKYVASLYSAINGLKGRISIIKIAFDIYNPGHIKSFADLVDSTKPKRIKLKIKGGDSNKSIFA
jgi:hypothetical protein